MQFEYKKVPIPEDPNAPWFPLPLVKVRLSYKDRIIQFDALIDSGADVSLFHASAAKALGINLRGGIKQDYFGVSGHKIEAYFHTVKFQIVGEAESIELAVGFTASEGVSALLGQADFFQAYKISFERYKERIEISPAPKK
jgi:aspartyl protease